MFHACCHYQHHFLHIVLDAILRIMVATVGFGMGIDILDVYRVIHWGLPKEPHWWWQEVGRCGRDQVTQCTAIVLATPLSIAQVAREKGLKTNVTQTRRPFNFMHRAHLVHPQVIPPRCCNRHSQRLNRRLGSRPHR